jgi:23S rRNA A1618 N6-methylase RlmF
MQFDEKGIRLIRVTGGLQISDAIKSHPDLIPFLRSQNPPRIDNENRQALLLYNKYIVSDVYQLDIEFEPSIAIIPTPVMRYNFLIHVLKPNATIIEIGTGGSAIIALLAAKHFGSKVIATEVEPEYLEYAQKNILRNHLQEKITLLNSHGKMLDGVIPFDTKVDYIISNPPYYDEIRSPKVLWGGKRTELVGGQAGEQFVVQMIQEGWKYLNPEGVISFIIPKTRTETLIKIEEFLQQQQYDYDIIGLLAGNRTRYVFRVYKHTEPINRIA